MAWVDNEYQLVSDKFVEHFQRISKTQGEEKAFCVVTGGRIGYYLEI